MLSVLLLEDEQLTREYLKNLIEGNPNVLKVYDTASGYEAISLAKLVEPDVAVLDIHLSDELPSGGIMTPINGLEVARMIRESFPDTEIVFVTGFKKYAIDAYSVHPYEYIVKPVNPSKIAQVLNGIARKVSFKRSPKIVIKQNQETFFIRPEEIIFIEKQQRETLIHTKEFICPTNLSLKEWEDILDKRVFLRVHQSFLINSNKIERITDLGNRSYQIIFKSYAKFALMSRYKFDDLNRKFFFLGVKKGKTLP